MEWKFWKWKKRGKAEGCCESSAPSGAAISFEQLSGSYRERELIALQRTVGNQAVLKLLGVTDGSRNEESATQSGRRYLETS